MSVLLLSPRAGRDPLSGDTSYTEALLACPPPGVTYVPYDEALAGGTMRLRGTRSRAARSGRDAAILAARTLELGLRRTGMAYREPTWFIDVDSASFDVLHQHLFAATQVRSAVPVFSSAGYPLRQLYASREQWPPWRIGVAEAFERSWTRTCRVHNPWMRGRPSSVMSVYSAASRDYVLQGGGSAEVRLLSTGLPDERVPTTKDDGRRLLFIGRDFERKGGPSALGAHRLLRSRGFDTSLTVVTRAPAPAELPEDVEWLIEPSRHEVVHDVLPAHDVLLAPTHSDCGVPYAVLEAMRAGLAIVTSDLQWLDERLGPPAAQRVVPTAASVADAAAELLAPRALPAAKQAARALFESQFTMEALGRDLRAGYDDARRKGRGCRDS